MAAAVVHDNPGVKPSELEAALELMYRAQRPTMIWGPPGVGKSKIMEQLCRRLGIKFLDIRLVIRDEVDMRGVPFVEKGQTKWAPPAEFPIDGKGILFLDEINAARPGVQAAAYQLVLDRKLGEYILPKGWVVMAAGNRDQDAAVTYRMPTALRNRFTHLELKVDAKDWEVWAVKNDIDPMVLAFIRFRPALLHQFDPSKNERAFATPRAWEFVSDIVKLAPAKDIELALYEGTVGKGPMIELISFMKLYRELPDIDEILDSPKKTPVPTQPATQYAVVTALARRATAENLGAVITYTDRLPVEYRMMCMRDIGLRDNKIFKEAGKVFLDWAVKHKQYNF